MPLMPGTNLTRDEAAARIFAEIDFPFAWPQFQYLDPSWFHEWLECRRRSGQQRKRPPVHRHDLSGTNQLGGARRCFRIHRKAIADGQEGNLGSIALANEAHVAEQAGVAGVIQRALIFEADHVARRFPHVHHLSLLDESAAVTSVGHRHTKACDRQRATLVHRRDVLQPLAAGPVAELERRDDRRSGFSSHRHEVFHVIDVAMRDEDQIDLPRFLEPVGAGRIVLQPRVEQQALSARRPNDECRVPQPGNGKPLHPETG